MCSCTRCFYCVCVCMCICLSVSTRAQLLMICPPGWLHCTRSSTTAAHTRTSASLLPDSSQTDQRYTSLSFLPLHTLSFALPFLSPPPPYPSFNHTLLYPSSSSMSLLPDIPALCKVLVAWPGPTDSGRGSWGGGAALLCRGPPCDDTVLVNNCSTRGKKKRC